jgi:DNA-3-methyladenine glycosylase
MRDLADYFSCQAVAKIPVCLENRGGPSSPEAKTCTLDLPLVKPRIIPRSFYGRSPDAVARGLLGKLLLHRWEGHRLMGRILETEAYGGQDDPASHAYGGISPFNEVLFGPPGFSDVYLIYGLHYCMNVSCRPAGEPGGILIRALKPVEGRDFMARLRGLPEGSSDKLLAGGPGRVCKALGINRIADHGVDVTKSSSNLQFLDDGYRPEDIAVTSRIGIKKAIDLPLRFLISEKQR